MKTISTYHKDEHENRDFSNQAKLIYVLQASAFIFGGIPFLIAIVLNYWNRPHVKGTWLESHYHWQIQTFWVTFAAAVFAFATLPHISAIIVLIITTIWVIHRIASGWFALNQSHKV